MPPPRTSPMMKNRNIRRVIAVLSGLPSEVSERGNVSAWAAMPCAYPLSSGSTFQQDRVLVRVRGRAAAEQDERLGHRVEQLVRRAGRDDDRVARPHVGLLVA